MIEPRFTRPATWEDVIDLDGLLLTKQSDRPKDQADAELLRQALARRKR